jgi:hypothetical protein
MPLSTIDTSSISGLGYGFKNRLINGGMVFSQRGTSAFTQTTSVTYSLDRWATYGSGGSQFTVQQLTASPPTGYKNYLGVVNSGTPVTPSAAQEWEVVQYIEGYNIADLGWGAAGAQSVTLSFWVKSSVIGSFGASLCNYNSTRTYPFSYTISAANTWEQKTITVAGDTTGTWNTDNTIGIGIVFSMGAGTTKSGTANTWAGANYIQPTGSVALVSTASATWQVTGVQLEAGTVATSFDWRPYGTELALCQRYYEKSYPMATAPGASSVTSGMSWLVNGYTSSGYVLCTTTFKATKRTAAAIAYWDAAGNSLRTTSLTGGGLSQVDNNNNIYATVASESGFFIYILASSTLNYGVQWTASAEL